MKKLKNVSGNCLSFSGVVSGECHNCLTDPLKNCFLKNKSVFVCFQRQGHREGTFSDSSLSVLLLHNKIVLAFQQFLSSGFLILVRIPGYFYGCNTDWVQLTHTHTYNNNNNKTVLLFADICYFVIFIYTLQTQHHFHHLHSSH